jgi:CheY-like chemotaxis protein
MIKPLGVQILWAENGTKALEILTTIKGIKIVTLDMIMPDMNGLELLSHIRSDQYSKKISKIGNDPEYVFITSNDNEADRTAGFNLGAVNFFSKDIKNSTLLQVCKNILTPASRFSELTVLIVNDSKLEISILKKSLYSLGVKIIEADDGDTALKIVKDKMQQLDLIITDNEMPRMNGDLFIKGVTFVLKLTDTPIIMLSSDTTKDAVLNFFKVGATDYISKPFIIEEFLARVKVHLQKQYLKKKHELQIYELQKLNSLRDDFIATCTHDLRTPLNGILGNAELLMESRQLDSKDKELSEDILRSGEYLVRLVNEMLDLKKSEDGLKTENFIPVNISEVAKNSVKSIKQIAEVKGILINCDIEQNHWVKGDSFALTRAINNILSNAIKFTPEDGTVSLSASIAENTCKLIIKDTGIGISPDKIPFLFDKYSKISRAGTSGEKSTGLGMSIVKSIITAHRGEIHVSSKPEKGTEFRITLETTMEPNFVEREDMDLSDLKILVADDQKMNLKLIEKMIVSMDAQVSTANDGLELLALYKKEQYDVIMTDINMPGMTGDELARTIRQENAGITIIAVTGHNAESLNWQEAGFNAVITKPINKRKIHDALTLCKQQIIRQSNQD